MARQIQTTINNLTDLISALEKDPTLTTTVRTTTTGVRVNPIASILTTASTQSVSLPAPARGVNVAPVVETELATTPEAAETLAGTTSEVLADDLNTRLTQAEADIDALDELKAPLASPALTGTPTAPTASQGTNTTQIATTQFVTGTITSSLALKAPLASPSFTGTVNFQTVSQTIVPLTGATGVVTHNLSNGAVFFHSSISANFTANFTNVPTTDDRGIGIAMILEQGGTGYLPTAVQIDGASATLRWAYDTVPTPSSNQIDTVSFTLVRIDGTWIVIAQHTNFA